MEPIEIKEKEKQSSHSLGEHGEHLITKDINVAVGEDEGIAQVGEEGIAISGWKGKAITGKKGVSIVEVSGVGQGGLGAVLLFLYTDSKNENEFVGCKVGNVRPNELEANVPYTLDLNNEIVPHFSCYSSNNLSPDPQS